MHRSPAGIQTLSAPSKKLLGAGLVVVVQAAAAKSLAARRAAGSAGETRPGKAHLALLVLVRGVAPAEGDSALIE
ncbi:MAG: hypothetical protein JWN34_5139 [Bryobacterales bacterium]|nr:hypothetical protein [Bryobacterales bacterium]